jgi:hypothetical protein
MVTSSKMNDGARLLNERVPLATEVGAEQLSSIDEDVSFQTDCVLSFVVGCLVAGALLVTGSSILNLLG